MTSYSTDQLEEVWSWVHDEVKCVTTNTISYRMGVNRQVASDLLRAVPFHSTAPTKTTEYEVSNCIYESKGEGRSTVKLVKSVLRVPNDDDSKINNDSICYSIRLKDSDAPSLWTAHEQDMALLRDQLQDEGDGSGATASNKKKKKVPALQGRCDIIAPAMEMDRLNLGAARQEQLAGMKNHTSHSTKSMATKRKATTAAAFFTKKATVSTNDKKTSAKANSSTSAKSSSSGGGKVNVEPSETKTTKKKPSTKASNKPVPAAFQPKHAKVASNKTSSTTMVKAKKKKTAMMEEEKENNNNRISRKKSGTADDFVGDVDEDEDFEKEEEERKKRNIKRRAKEAAKKAELEEAIAAAKESSARRSSTEDEPPVVVVGTKRRKKLVTKTFVGDDGYLQTEQQVQWEEVPEEELKAEAAAEAAKKKVKATQRKKISSAKHMKQGSLKGFFVKK